MKKMNFAKNMFFAAFLIISISNTACKQNQRCNEIKYNSNNIDTTKVSIYLLLNQILKNDTFEFNNQFIIESNLDFIFAKTGNFLFKNNKSTIIVTCPTDSTYLVKLYLNELNKLVLFDSAIITDAFPSQFDFKVEDYNFDNQDDFYIQRSFSNGYGMSRGYLFLVDRKIKKINLLKKSLAYGNLKPNADRKILYSEEWLSRENNGNYLINFSENKWENDKLILLKKTIKSIY